MLMHALRNSQAVQYRYRPSSCYRSLGAPTQVGNLPPPGTAPKLRGDAEHTLQLVTADSLADARRWVATWPEARGATCLLPAMQLSQV